MVARAATVCHEALRLSGKRFLDADMPFHSIAADPADLQTGRRVRRGLDSNQPTETD